VKHGLTAILLTLLACGQAPAARPAADGPRIVTLAPHLAELVFAVGGGERLVGVSAYTDYPEAAAALPVIGDAFMLDLERLSLLQPDLLLAWQSGTPAHVIDELKARGFRVEVVRTQHLEDISRALLRIGDLVGRPQAAADRAREFEDGLERLRDQATGAAAISVFYQVAERPLYTVNGDHYVSELIELCGGRNVFDDLGSLAPLIGVEAVLARDPEVLMASSDAGPDAFAAWDRWPEMAANRYGNRFRMPAAEIGRATPRLVAAGEAMCAALETGREHREQAAESQ